MLHAFTQNKSRIYSRYLGIRDGDEKRIPAEDEITSIIFSPLSFLPDAAIGAFWLSVVAHRNPSVLLTFPEGKVSKAKIHFWQRSGIEPDLVVRLEWPNGEKRTILVELKWRSPLSPPDQLQQQWLQYIAPAERESAYHIFIAPDVSSGETALGDDVWSGRLLLRPWHQMVDVLEGISGTEALTLAKWSSEVVKFLQLLRIAPFRGFNGVQVVPVPSPQAGLPYFWSAFSGFKQFMAPAQENTSHKLEQLKMTDIGKSIRDAQIFIGQVGEECTRLAIAIKSEISRALNSDWACSFDVAATQWTPQSSSTSSGNWVCQGIISALPIRRKGEEDTLGYLFFQISLSGSGTDAVNNVEPLVHIGFWQDVVRFSDNYFCFPIAEEGLTVTIDHGRLIHWHHEECENEWTYSLPLTSLNNPADLQRCVTAPIGALLNNDGIEQALIGAGAVHYQKLGQGRLEILGAEPSMES